jgi:hypothetical protein
LYAFPTPFTPRPPSTWRLVNLALALSALLAVVCSFGGLAGVLPSRWLARVWLSPDVVAGVPLAWMLPIRIGLDLWLPASMLLLVFVAKGLHRRAAAAAARWVGPTLALTWIAGGVTLEMPLPVGHADTAGAVMLLVGLVISPLYLGLAVAAIAASSREWSALNRPDAARLSGSPRTLLAWAVLPPFLGVLLLLAAPGHPLTAASRQRQAFDALCKEAGTRFVAKPATPVRSIAYVEDDASRKVRPEVNRIEVDGGGRILTYGGWGGPRSSEGGKRLHLDFTERPHDPSHEGPALTNPEAPYYHFPGRDSPPAYYGVDALTADALAALTAEDVGPLPGGTAHAVRFHLTLTDRRSGALLGVQTFVVDQEGGRACGVNVDSAISQEAFIHDAIAR